MLVLDPYFFKIDAVPGAAFGAHVGRLKGSLKRLLGICRGSHLRIAVERSAWRYLEVTWIKPLVELAQDHELNVALSVLRHDYLSEIPDTAIGGCRTWGVKPLFNGLTSHEDLMLANSVTAAILYISSTGTTPYFFIHDKLGRNVLRHSTGHSSINEITRWRIYLTAPALAGPQHAVCIRQQRNISILWTTRYDSGLPDGGTYNFEPPSNWHKKDVNAVRTLRSKPAFIDIRGNGWVCPNTPGTAEHWDLFIEDRKMATAVGLDQLNIWKYLSSSSPGGEIHHVPVKKISKLH